MTHMTLSGNSLNRNDYFEVISKYGNVPEDHSSMVSFNELYKAIIKKMQNDGLIPIEGD